MMIAKSYLDKVLLKNVVESWVQFFPNILEHQGSAQWHRVLQVLAEVFVVEGGHLL